ncbi:hypothetical protein EPUS_03795 [Endocarpon pusillum Z07020]|uniref:Uncharacterized protein n=1 Tax=Endocarpon pusillum (strain Z07020 / HMAS-L-300199) TaxID=1263415 RepID=U1GPT4_ENDPU|nr:uncharacterized protein EPUS_03795 [Endocarpon pusillum Z07020]ERF73981.1 hypothetical protein EPUS_03795 [Endocarpon pusillum Z07020]
MEFSPEIPQPIRTSAETRTLQVDFSWKKLGALISEYNNPQSDPIYIVDLKRLKAPHLIFKSASDDSAIGTGTLHAISIDADYEVHAQKGSLKARKRFRTEYTYLSRAFSDNDSPVTMTWTGSCGLRTWDFVCVDEQQLPVAKFTAYLWAMKQMGKIEFLGPHADSDAVRDEIVVTGLTLLYCMLLRTNSILSFFGAVFSRPGHDKGVRPESQQFLGDNDRANAQANLIGRSSETQDIG